MIWTPVVDAQECSVKKVKVDKTVEIHLTLPALTPGGAEKHDTIEACKNSNPDWLTRTSNLCASYVVSGTSPTDVQRAAFAEVERACRVYTKEVTPNTTKTILLSGLLYGAAGAGGVGAGSKMFAGASFANYAGYGGAASFTAGVANGIISLGGKRYTFESCVETLMDRVHPEYKVHPIIKAPTY